ncbi:UDP-N-acetylmuramoyl-tripeptide--D-alanyl-D-alanine ligase [Salinicoccus kekensis]|uniref:UDP-N-acetylmuramoyl-tripeptide--D-alanyl-D-alanine ligase n=1 Tax=Salinicoccus kekensis TaxID=714307 RepID=A0A285UHN1_9STAP|nr:UDP-N-acetylmuramoyl-tripeptide--D-alanyl-D-alanine ligase [Salinicoccus kekensis]SOC41197.1 UDP-N-acetylmuramoyl-tripeptide--D-alanyl-D-alanine ligase [Salinicoccus kekensis]
MEKTLYLDRPTVAITGSFGKTTAKEITASILSVKYDIYKSNNSNTINAVRKHVKRITDKHEAIVLEMAMNIKGTGKTKCTMIQPNIGVITSVGHAHFKHFNSIYEIVKSKSEMMKYMDPKGTLYLNFDDEYSQFIDTQYFTGDIVKCGVSSGADYRATDIRFNNDGMEFFVKLKGVKERMFVPVLGEHNVINALFGIAIADKFNFSADEIRKGLENVEVQKGRLALEHLEGNRKLLDDSHNANPASMIAGLKVLNNYIDGDKKIALLGDMAELGSFNREGHEKVGTALKKFEFDKVYLYGQSSKYILNKAVEVGFSENKLFHFDNIDHLIEEIVKEFEENTTLMVKASHATNFSKVVEKILDIYKRVE